MTYKKGIRLADYLKDITEKELANLRAKAKAYDDGKKTFAVTPITAPKVITATGPTAELAWTKARQFLGMLQNGNKVDGYTCRKVKVCEVVE